MSSGNNITQQQLFFLVIQAQIGVGILSLAFNVFDTARQDGWISMLVAGLAIQVAIVVIWMLCRRFPSSMLFDILSRLLGKWIGNIVNSGYLIYFTFTAAAVLAVNAQVIKNWILPATPSWVISFLMTFTGIYVCTGNLRVLARFFTVVSVLLVVLFLVTTYGLREANFIHLFPIGEAGGMKILSGAKEAILAILGFDLLLVIYPFVQGKSSGILKKVSLANLLVTLFYTYTIVITLAYFSPNELKLVPEPIIYMLKTFEFPVFARVDLVFLSIWLVSVATSFMIYLFMASKGIAYMFHRSEKHYKFVPWLGGMVFIVSLIPGNDELKVSAMSTYASNLSFIFTMGIPAFLLIISYLFRKKENEVKADDN
ncbi:spore germination protein (amino acid permease) [Lentibacillus persicus]|uniref:Spore germination protein (Amino acid permease) n=1 Tax=Lentibacillus persicus TaxID=640948 RepID=A0A1I2AVL7_9BACI|nr:GerAB/ArcD/ProY family transporter [Lentibacillus persicus]SFE48001.1 spore germination protein (amino acid permease) [Lentibacillus persicus]